MLVKILQKQRSLLSNSNLTEKIPILFNQMSQILKF